MLEKAREFNNADNIISEQGISTCPWRTPWSSEKMRMILFIALSHSITPRILQPPSRLSTKRWSQEADLSSQCSILPAQHRRLPTGGFERMMERPFWELESYGSEGPRTVDFLDHPLHVHHRTMETYVSLLLENGFILVDFKECIPPPGALPETHPDYGKEVHRPLYLILAAKKGWCF
jgi:hypothetical protein